MLRPRLSKRERLFAVLAFVGSTALCLGLAETILRFLPVASGMPAAQVTADSPVFHFIPNRDFLFSRDWDMAMPNRGHVNNVGFVNDQDYRKDDRTPLLAVVGDSYVEAAMVPYPETLHARLARRLEGKLRVYSFAASAAPLSQYLIWARHAVSEYGATALVINVVGNDFDDSLASYFEQSLVGGTATPGFWVYAWDANNTLRLKLYERRQPRGRITSHSALARYLLFNVRIAPLISSIRALFFARPAEAAPRYAGNTAADANTARVNDSLAAIDAFFRDLPGFVGLSPERVTFTMDGFRYPERAAEGAGTYFDLMRRAFRRRAEADGYEVIDLDPLFFMRHQRTGERFEYPRDGHWNGTGHEVAFEAIMSSRLVKALVR
jgi:hypothetical protein